MFISEVGRFLFRLIDWFFQEFLNPYADYSVPPND